MLKMGKAFRSGLALLLLVTGAFAVTAVACGDDDDDGGSVEVIDGDPDPEAEPDPEADPDPEPDPEAHDAGAEVTPGPKPDGATQLDVTLAEWSVTANVASVPAGDVYFLVENEGPEHPHEFVVIKTALAADELPTVDGRVPEDAVDLLGEIEPFAVGSTGSLTLDLAPGTYLLLCNIVEEAHDGTFESHYELGMRTSLTVE
jgi:uncharacterized cupredoxin-like copper-binding protein